jgi:hypothetical protein
MVYPVSFDDSSSESISISSFPSTCFIFFVLTMLSSAENTPLVTTEQASMAASGAATLINASADKIKKARMEGPLTFRTLGFIGGLAMIVSNGFGIIDRFFSFNFTGCLIAIYGVLFGVLSE